MPQKVTLFGRLRIECLVWALDQQLYDLPRRSRIDKRREVRANLLEAAQDQGVREALRRIGSSRQLAREYLGAEFGDRPHHSWMGAAWFAALVPLAINFVLSEVQNAYTLGLTDANPAGTGVHTWSGLSFLQNPITVTLDHGQITRISGGAWTPLVYVLWLAGTIICGRLWRLLPSVQKSES